MSDVKSQNEIKIRKKINIININNITTASTAAKITILENIYIRKMNKIFLEFYFLILKQKKMLKEIIILLYFI